MTIRDDDLLNLLKPDMDKSRAYQSELSAEREKYYRWYRADIAPLSTGMALR